MLPLRSLVGLACLTICVGCAENSFNIQYLPGFARQSRHISMFGIRRDGMMSHDGWAALGPNVSPPFNGDSCDVAYAQSSWSAHPALLEAIDSYVRENGVSDPLLGALAPAAQGDTIMFVTIAGHAHAAPSRPSGSIDDPVAPASSAGGRHGRHGGGHASSASGDASGSSDSDQFTATALFYSIGEHRTVGRIELRYGGASAGEALALFRGKLESEFPGAACSGWNWNVDLAPERIRTLAEQ